ncbi:glycosyltransferase [Algoriphagus sp. AGSA1]|uniref:glycosyltransferase n=1 Tax=Algoriphagus sp. AGSA1 TaxID=2907213 RepID=UPI001F44F703|nr:glycosyltransferase [Algoriphagus sp. AGSA1]MCE7054132.1 glycosyltransferase [Algoriphagus sp. AGSA1]
MRIARIVSELDFGGVEQVMANSLPELNKKGQIELTVLVLGRGGRVSEQLKSQGIKVVIWNKNPRIPNFQLLFQLRKYLKKLNPDVVHTQGAEANFHGILAGEWAGVSNIIGEEIGLPNHHSFWRYIFKYVYAKANHVIAISKAVEKAIVGLGEVDPNKVKVLYNPVKTRQCSVISSQVSEKNRFVFVTTCRLVRIKNLERLIQAFEGLVKENQERGLFLRIVGDGPEREKLEVQSKKLGLSSKVRFLGFQQDVWPFLQEANAFILPSLREGSSVSLAEAMAARLPSIITQVGGASEVLGDSKSGYLIDPLSSDSIQYAMKQLIDLSHEERHAMGERARKEAKRFTVENYIQSLMSIYTLSDFIPKPSAF